MKWFEVVKRNQFSVKIWNVNSAWYRDIGPFYIITLKDEVDGDLALLRRMLAANMLGDLLLLFCLMLRCLFFFSFFSFFFPFVSYELDAEAWAGGGEGHCQAKSADHLLYVQKSSEWLSSNRKGGWFFFFCCCWKDWKITKHVHLVRNNHFILSSEDEETSCLYL